MHIITRRLSWFWMLLFLVTLTACGMSPTATAPTPTEIFIPTRIRPTPLFELPAPPPKTPQPLQALQQSWLNDPVCQPPCWQGITPGKTSVKDAVTILNRLPFITNIQFNSLASDEEQLLIWDWTGSDHGSGSLGFAQKAQTPLVSQLTLSFPQSYRLSDILAVYGEPSHVVPSFVDTATAHVGRTIFYDLRLIYLEKGFFLETERTFSGPPRLAPDMVLDGGVTFFAPTRAGLDTAKNNLMQGTWRSADLIPWQGFEDFESYCRQARPPDETDEMCGRTLQ